MGVMAFLNFTFVDLSVFPKDSGSAKVKAATRKTIHKVSRTRTMSLLLVRD